MTDPDFGELLAYLARVPAVDTAVGHGVGSDGRWWVKLIIDIDHPLAWHVVQELAHVLNQLSLDERLPTTFKPVSPPPYLNGGPADFLSWIIESESAEFPPERCAAWLEGRLPRPVDDLAEWSP